MPRFVCLGFETCTPETKSAMVTPRAVARACTVTTVGCRWELSIIEIMERLMPESLARRSMVTPLASRSFARCRTTFREKSSDGWRLKRAGEYACQPDAKRHYSDAWPFLSASEVHA